MLYSSQTWFTFDRKRVISHYNNIVKCLLSDRKNTSTNMSLVESGIRPISYVIAKKMKSFLQEKLQSMDIDEPLYPLFIPYVEVIRQIYTKGIKS